MGYTFILPSVNGSCVPEDRKLFTLRLQTRQLFGASNRIKCIPNCILSRELHDPLRFNSQQEYTIAPRSPLVFPRAHIANATNGGGGLTGAVLWRIARWTGADPTHMVRHFQLQAFEVLVLLIGAHEVRARTMQCHS